MDVKDHGTTWGSAPSGQHPLTSFELFQAFKVESGSCLIIIRLLKEVQERRVKKTDLDDGTIYLDLYQSSGLAYYIGDDEGIR